MYEIRYTRGAAKSLSHLGHAEQRRLKRALAATALSPRARAKKLIGMDDLWRIRVGDYRVIYEIEDDILVVLVIRIAHRKDAYRPSTGSG